MRGHFPFIPGAAGVVLIGLGGVSALAPNSSAQIYFYDTFDSAFYGQVSEGAVYPFDEYIFTARITHTSTDDYTSATISVPGINEPLEETIISDQLSIYYSDYFSDETTLLQAYPRGTYTHTIAGGTQGTASASLERDDEWWPDSPPMFVNGTFTAMQAIDPSADFPVWVSNYSATGPANLTLTFVIVTDAASGETAFNEYYAQPLSGLVIPANTLLPDSSYYITLYHSSRQEYAGAGFDGATAIVAFDRVTSALAFTTSGSPPCFADFNQDGGVDGADVEAFFAQWVLGDPSADTNIDGGVDGADVETFFVQWSAGGC